MSSGVGPAFERVVTALTRLGVPFFVGGSVASSTHGLLRATGDVDIIADLRPQQADALAAELGRDFYADPDMIRQALSLGRGFNVIHYATTFKFDILPLRSLFERQQLKRANQVTSSVVGGEQVQFPAASPEDTILAKLRWFKAGNCVSEQQWRDVQGVIRVQAERLDLGYLREWAAELGVAELLEGALAEGGIGLG
jgi:hypothetical protein